MDYIAACQLAGCALLGGETAEMPGVYQPDEFDLVGTVVGVVDRQRIIDGQSIEPGDRIVGLASSGLHTNGYSLARRVFQDWDLTVTVPELQQPLGEALLAPHRAYLAEVQRAGHIDDDEMARVFNLDLVVLAGWMLILSPAFLDRFPGRIINLHPALPGQFPGAHAIERAYEAFQQGQIEQTGVMVHRVIPEIDVGPVIVTAQVPIKAGDTLADLETRVHAVEHRLIVEAIRRVFSGS